MYHNSYGDTQTARQLFAEIAQQIRDKMLTVDYAPAELRCPQRLPIARLMSQAMRHTCLISKNADFRPFVPTGIRKNIAIC